MARAVQLLGLRACLTESIMDTGEGLPASWAVRTTDHCIQVLLFTCPWLYCVCIMMFTLSKLALNFTAYIDSCIFTCVELLHTSPSHAPIYNVIYYLLSILFVEIMSLPGVHFI